MNKKISYLITLFLCCILLVATFSGCIKEEQKPGEGELSVPEVKLDQPLILPDWKDGEYHDYYGTMDLIQEFQIKYPDLVNVFSIGKSVLGKDIWCIRITNENNTKTKSSCLIDGCITEMNGKQEKHVSILLNIFLLTLVIMRPLLIF